MKSATLVLFANLQELILEFWQLPNNSWNHKEYILPLHSRVWYPTSKTTFSLLQNNKNSHHQRVCLVFCSLKPGYTPIIMVNSFIPSFRFVLLLYHLNSASMDDFFPLEKKQNKTCMKSSNCHSFSLLKMNIFTHCGCPPNRHNLYHNSSSFATC